MAASTCILILCKNPILGKAKTRLANSVGDEKALEIYHFLLQYTAGVVAKVPSDKRIYYSDEVLQQDVFQGVNYHKDLQVQGDLGERMQTVFEEAFEAGYGRAVIIGSDCYELSSELLEQALAALNNHDVVLGPAQDGGYYLLGLRQHSPNHAQLLKAIFNDQPWSQSNLLNNTLSSLEDLNARQDVPPYQYYLLPELKDVDHLEDLPLDVRAKFGV